MPVSIPSGQTTESRTPRTPWAFSSACSARVHDSTPAFAAAYAASPGTGAQDASEATVMTRPGSDAGRDRITSTAARVPWITPSRSTSTTWRITASSWVAASPAPMTPAQLTHTSGRTSWASARHASASRTSSTRSAPAMSVPTTAYPRAASPATSACPKPPAAPVTTAVRVMGAR